MKDFPMIRTTGAGVLGTLLIAAPLLLLSQNVITGIYAILLVMYLLPMAACLVAGTSGILPGAVSALCGVFAVYRVAGAVGAELAALYVVPVFAAFLIVIGKRMPFFRGCAVMIGVHLVTLLGCVLILQSMVGEMSLYEAAGEAVYRTLPQYGWCDSVLYEFYDIGYLSLSSELVPDMVIKTAAGWELSAAARTDLLLTLRSSVISLMTSLLPTFIVGHSIWSGVSCLFLPLRFGESKQRKRVAQEQFVKPEEVKAEDVAFPDLQMPALRDWFIPRGKGWKVGLAFALGLLLQLVGNSNGVVMAGILLYAGASAVLSIQGLAMVNYIQHKKNRRIFWRAFVPGLFMLFGMMHIAGLFDQMFDIRLLRRNGSQKEEM